MPVDVWASDAEYSPPASVGVDQSTKVEPSAGSLAQGLVPGAHAVPQWLNYYLNALAVLLNATETTLNARSIQAAYARSVALAETAPHLDIEGSTFVIGGTDSAILFRVDGATGQISLLSGVTVEGGIDVDDGDLDVGGGNAVITSDGDITAQAITAAGLLTAEGNAQVDGNAVVDGTLSVGGGSVLSTIDSGTAAAVLAAVSGTNAVVGDLTEGDWWWTRIGAIVSFTLRVKIDLAGYISATTYTMDFTLPVASNLGGLAATATVDRHDSSIFNNVFVEAQTTTDRLRLKFDTNAPGGSETWFYMTGHYTVA